MSHKTTVVTTDPTTWPAQLTLPGQSHTAAGPHDQTGMYAMHHGFRRDLDLFVAAVRRTPVSQAEVWQALHTRWLRMADVLHHHHEAEDEHLWPVLCRHAEAAGRAEDLATLADMEAEHGVIDPALVAARRAFEAMAEHPCEDHRNALDIRVTSVREHLLTHLAHEEGQALPVLQRTMSVEENRAFEAAVGKAYPARIIPFVLCWVMHELPEEARARIAKQAGPGYLLVHGLLRRRFERREREAFRYV